MEKFLADVQQTEYNPFEEKRNWRDWIKQNLIATHQMIIPTMPNARNASYLARKIWFEKLFPYLNNEGVILI
ncbi:MAG: hypothetical protein LBP53_07690 [Candidatus Peribacteria bacterium]|jgi:hypothetical protein|nr:hypothetical protein [Candidatus Peribacteria bacterium]